MQVLIIPQDNKAKDEATRAISDNTEKIKKQRKKLEEHEVNLAREESILEEIRDSLKG